MEKFAKNCQIWEESGRTFVAVLIKREDTAREHCLGWASSPSLPVWLVSPDKAKGGWGVGRGRGPKLTPSYPISHPPPTTNTNLRSYLYSKRGVGWVDPNQALPYGI